MYSQQPISSELPLKGEGWFNESLAGWNFKHFVCSSRTFWGEMESNFDYLAIFKWIGEKPPTRKYLLALELRFAKMETFERWTSRNPSLWGKWCISIDISSWLVTEIPLTNQLGVGFFLSPSMTDPPPSPGMPLRLGETPVSNFHDFLKSPINGEKKQMISDFNRLLGQWQLKYIYFCVHPEPWGFMESNFMFAYFSKGLVKNRQPD